MIKLFKRIFIFGIVFMLVALFIFIVDAYNIFFDSNFIENEYKFLTVKRSNEVMPRGVTLWKLNEFSKNPHQNIIIGDSKAMGFDTKIINEITNEDYYNIAVPGGNFRTIEDMFWFTNDKVKLKNVFIQVSFGSYSSRVNYDLVKSVNSYLMYPFKMFFKSWFIFDSYIALQYKIIQKPSIEAEEDILNFQQSNIDRWNEILQQQGYDVLRDYDYPEKHYARLKKISEYCYQNNINLTFIILPSHPDYFKIMEEMNLEHHREKFLQDINGLGHTIDYSSSEYLSSNKSLYLDLHHVKHSIIDSLSYEIWQ